MNDSSRPCIQIIRGLPGSGKSTLARKFDCLHFELDMYCIRAREYRWSPERDKTARNLLLWRIRDEMREGVDLVVAGVMPSASGILGAIVGYACEFGYRVYIKTLTTDFGNIHNVRECDLENMRRAFRDELDIREQLRIIFPLRVEWLDTCVHYGLMQTTATTVPFAAPSITDVHAPCGNAKTERKD